MHTIFPKITARFRYYKREIGSFWWTILFCLISFFIFEQARFLQNHTLDALTERQNMLYEKLCHKTQLLEKKRLEIAYKDDPEWIAFLLKSTLGVIGENETKVIFTHD